MFKWFKSNDIDFSFVDKCDGTVYPHYPPVLAKDVKPILKSYQENNSQKYSFPQCPGMYDYARMGYIIPAWSNFFIKSNKAGTVALVGSIGEDAGKRTTIIRQPQPMDKEITKGLFEMQDNINHEIYNFPSAWGIKSSKNISCLILPAIFHSNFLDDLFVYPGVVDYNEFTVLNFICSPKRACEIKITAGDPILHVIPILHTKDIVADYGPGSIYENDTFKISRWFNEKNFYRRFFMIRKKYRLFKRY